MTQRIFVDRSRYETYGRCPRARYENYHRGGMGIESVRKPLPLAVGGSVHVGLAHLLRGSVPFDRPPMSSEDRNAQAKMEARLRDERIPSASPTAGFKHQDWMWMALEDDAVAAALRDFAQYDKSLELPDAEAAILTTQSPETLTTQLMDSMQMQTGRAEAVELARSEMNDYLYREQVALVEALVRAYSRRRLRPLLEQFEVLEVEREGEWLLWENSYIESETRVPIEEQIWFMSRPDALLRERESNELYLLSYKTTGAWDVRKARDAEHDMQGMSEGVEIERRLAEWWRLRDAGQPTPERVSMAMVNYLDACDSPPRILAVRYEYMLKGERWKDRELSERFGVEMRSQKSHLIRRYEAVSVPQRGAAGYYIGDKCWSWDYIREDGRNSSLAWQNWKSRAVFEAVTGGVHVIGGVKEWIDALDDAAPTMSGEDSTMGLEPRLLGYKCDAQAVGVTKDHPLDAIFIPPVTVYRNEDELRDLVDQMESVERRIAEGVAAVDSATDEGERRHALNIHFPQTRRACEYPTTCAYSKVCYGGEEIRRDPVASGLYKIRTPNHPQESADAKG